MLDFNKALQEVTPAFGSDKESLESYRLNGIINYSSSFEHLHNTILTLVHQVCRLALPVTASCRRISRLPRKGGNGRADCALQ